MSWLGDIFGGGAKQAQGAIIQGSNQAGNILTTGQNEALANYGTGWNTYNAATQPFVSGGRTAFDAYQNILGLNGAAGQETANAAYFNNPATKQMQALLMQGINRQYAGTGQGGAATQAMTNSLLQGYTGYQDRLAGAAAQGQAAGFQYGNAGYGYGSDLAKTNAGFSQLQANRLIGQGNAVANIDLANQAMGMNFLGGLIGAGGKMLSGPMGGSLMSGASSAGSGIFDWLGSSLGAAA